MLSKANIFVAKIFEPSPEEFEALGGSSQKPNGTDIDSGHPFKKSKVEEEARKDDDKDFELSIKEDIEPSTKMRRMLDNIVQMRVDYPEDKCIVYSQCAYNLLPLDSFYIIT